MLLMPTSSELISDDGWTYYMRLSSIHLSNLEPHIIFGNVHSVFIDSFGVLYQIRTRVCLLYPQYE
jgi:hypothetical protein